jgi:hypothetical protein
VGEEENGKMGKIKSLVIVQPSQLHKELLDPCLQGKKLVLNSPGHNHSKVRTTQMN